MPNFIGPIFAHWNDREKYPILVCGNSEIDNPRDKTIMRALDQLHECVVLDLRVKREMCIKSHGGKFNIYKLVLKVKKHVLTSLVKRLINKRAVDLVLVMKLNPSFVSLCHLWARFSKVPVAYDLWVSRKLAAERDMDDTKIVIELESKTLADSDIPFSTSEPYKEYYSETYRQRNDKIRIVPLAVTDEWFSRPLVPLINKTPFIVSYWGNFLKHHGIEIFLGAARELMNYDDIIFHVFGSDKSGSMEVIINSATPNVIFWGRTAVKELIGFVDKSNVGVGHLLPIHDAHLMLPNKALECMARARPVIHIDNPSFYNQYGTPDSDEAAVYFFRGGCEGLATAILDLKFNFEKAKKIGANARKVIEEFHSCSVVEKSILNFIKSTNAVMHN